MIRRRAAAALGAALASSPVVALVGARQTGKTTLARSISSGRRAEFYDLENPTDRLLLEDPLRALRVPRGHLVVLDEAQRMPELFPVLRVLVDEDRRAGRFLILGSATPDLRRQSAESLAGRVETLELTGFTAEEVVPRHGPIELLWARGGLPPSFRARSDAESMRWRIAYTRSLVERDLALVGFEVAVARMERFVRMLAHVHGQLWNASHLARSLDLGATTAGRYLDALEDTFLVRRLPAFSANLGKRLTRAPKAYIRDTGLLHALLALESPREILEHPVAGFSWEGFVIEQLAAAAPPGWEMTFWRTAAGAEIDLVILRGGKPRVAVEMKMNETSPRPSRGFFQGCEDLEIGERWVVYPGERTLPLPHGVTAFPVTEAVRALRRLA